MSKLGEHTANSINFSCKLIFAESDALLRGIGTGYGQFQGYDSAVYQGSNWGTVSVSKAVARFLTICNGRFEYADEKNKDKKKISSRPAYLEINWGKVLMQPKPTYDPDKIDSIDQEVNSCSCQLQSVGVNYTLFSRQGEPLRAELDCKFVGDATAEVGQKSPGGEPSITTSSSIGNVTFGKASKV